MVTITLAVVKFPLASVAVKVILFAPLSLQPKLVLLNDKLLIAQLSVEPLFTC